MPTSRTHRSAIIGLALTGLLGLGTAGLSLQALAQPPAPDNRQTPPPPPDGDQRQQHLAQQLGLSAEQARQLDALLQQRGQDTSGTGGSTQRQQSLLKLLSPAQMAKLIDQRPPMPPRPPMGPEAGHGQQGGPCSGQPHS